MLCKCGSKHSQCRVTIQRVATLHVFFKELLVQVGTGLVWSKQQLLETREGNFALLLGHCVIPIRCISRVWVFPLVRAWLGGSSSVMLLSRFPKHECWWCCFCGCRCCCSHLCTPFNIGCAKAFTVYQQVGCDYQQLRLRLQRLPPRKCRCSCNSRSRLAADCWLPLLLLLLACHLSIFCLWITFGCAAAGTILK